MNFTDFFDRIFVISREDRPERRARCEEHLKTLGLDEGIEWFPAIVGRLATAPAGWNAGAGGWGCLQSHLAVMNAVWSSGVSSVLILEDDVVFSRHVHWLLPKIMAALPPLWHQIYLGGQHLVIPEATASPLIHRGRNVIRTHAYAVHGKAIPLIHQQLRTLARYGPGRSCHIDAQMGLAHERMQWETFAPSWWLAGQSACMSDVWKGKPLPERWWHLPRYALRLPYVAVPRRSDLDPQVREGLLFSDEEFLPRKHSALLAIGLRSDASLCRWLRCHAEQALVFSRLPVWEGNMERLASLWPAGVIGAEGINLLQLRDYPFNRLFSHPVVDSTEMRPISPNQPTPHEQRILRYARSHSGAHLSS